MSGKIGIMISVSQDWGDVSGFRQTKTRVKQHYCSVTIPAYRKETHRSNRIGAKHLHASNTIQLMSPTTYDAHTKNRKTTTHAKLVVGMVVVRIVVIVAVDVVAVAVAVVVVVVVGGVVAVAAVAALAVAIVV